MDNNTRREVRNYMNSLLKDQTWKGPAIIGAICMLIVALLNSFLFALIVGLLKLGFFIAGAGLLLYAAYLGYPVLVKRLKDAQNS